MHRVVIRETMSLKGLVHNVVIALGLLVFCAQLGWPQARLSAHWEDLTADDFRSAIKQSQGTCLLPFGILEKHGPHLPLSRNMPWFFPSITLARSLKPGTSPVPLRTAGNSSCSCCRKPPTRWRATVVRRSSS